MKTRLPKALLTALLMSFITHQAVAEGKIIEVGTVSGTNAANAPSSNIQVYGETDLTLTGDDKVGVIRNGEPVTQFGYNQATAYNKLEGESAGLISKHFKVNGTLSINDRAQVILGGQYRWEEGLFTKTAYDEFTGIIADTINVNTDDDVTGLNVHNANVNTLNVSGGKVLIHTHNEYSLSNTVDGATSGGNTGIRIEVKDSKQAQIKKALTVTGGEVTLGAGLSETAQNDTQCAVAFGSVDIDVNNFFGITISADIADIQACQITQEGGTLTVNARSVSAGGLQVDQSGGRMSISEGLYHILADYGDCVITQSGDSEETTMHIGGILAYNYLYKYIYDNLDEAQREAAISDFQASLRMEQSGNGTIYLGKSNDIGVDFRMQGSNNAKTNTASTETSSISQTGDGKIVLRGAYLGADFEIEQSGKGEITLEAGASMRVSKLDINSNADLNVAGSLTLVDDTAINITLSPSVTAVPAALSADFLTDDEVFLFENDTAIDVTGDLALGNNISISLQFSEDMLREMVYSASDDGTQFIINLINGGIDESELSKISLTIADYTYSGIESITSNGLRLQNGTLQALVTVTGSVPEPTSSMLGLMGLVAFTLRRRRK